MSSQVYESKKVLSEYLAFHYGQPDELMPYDFGPKDALDFPKRCADLCLKHFRHQEGAPSRALDIGCAVGRSSFELARGVDQVLGIDYSQSFIDCANRLRDTGQVDYELLEEGDLFRPALAQVPQDIERVRVTFEQGDACKLRPDLGAFDLVLAANLICRLHHPRQFLSQLTRLMPRPGALLVITAPYTWMTEFTDKSEWLGGRRDEAGDPVTGFDGLQKELSLDFELLQSLDMPFIIRETRRKNQWTVAHATVWRRR
ncbi:uncharacterized protein LOC131935705 [Physella acuta]|uniref:uncharacterized protein LOC131935705 n=1 Tax=Physella acuta TaxID=109671 RepID=UPI0027DC4712|nr:uncharacterized protein LOC131935705 [Physella acuta]